MLLLRADLTALQLQVRRAKTDADALAGQLDRRLLAQAAESERQSAAIAQRLEGLGKTLTALAARMDEIGARAESIQTSTPAPRPAAPLAPAVSAAPSPRSSMPPQQDSTPAPQSSTPPSPTATPAPHSSTPPPQTATPSPTSRPATGPLQPRDIYQAAYIDFSKGSYQLAIAGFREFLRRFPDHDLADDAQYWIGEAYFGLARGYGNAGQADKATQSLEQAIQEFKKVVANYPRGEKTPTALYKQALALIELKRPELAQSQLQYLVDNFPQAAETSLARERLASLKDR